MHINSNVRHRTETSHSHTCIEYGDRVAGREGFGELSYSPHSPLPNINFRFKFQSSFLLNHFRFGPNTYNPRHVKLGHPLPHTYRIYSNKRPTSNKRPSQRQKKLISAQPRISAHPSPFHSNSSKRPQPKPTPLPPHSPAKKLNKYQLKTSPKTEFCSEYFTETLLCYIFAFCYYHLLFVENGENLISAQGRLIE